MNYNLFKFGKPEADGDVSNVVEMDSESSSSQLDEPAETESCSSSVFDIGKQ